MDELLTEGSVPLFDPARHYTFTDIKIPPVSDEAREKRNAKRRLRYAAKYSKKVRHAQLRAQKEELEAEVKKLRKILKEAAPAGVKMPLKKRKVK